MADIATLQQPPQALITTALTIEKIDLLKRTICKGSTDDELALFVATCNRLVLDPFARQIYAVKRWDKKEGKEVMAIQVSIDGFRLIASRTNAYEGQSGPYWCGPDGEWQDVWLSKDSPMAAKVGVWREKFREPIWSIATWESYAQIFNSGLSPMWQKFGPLMLAKCAEALSLRRAFPAELSNVYAPEEMGQAEIAEPVAPAQRQIVSAPSSETVDGMLVLQAAIELASSPEELERVSVRIRRAVAGNTITKDERASLLPLYRERLAILTDAQGV